MVRITFQEQGLSRKYDDWEHQCIYWWHNYFWRINNSMLHVRRRVCFVNVQVPRPHSNIYVKLCNSRLCMKMSSFLFLRTWAMPRVLYLSCGVPFPVWTPDNISGLISVVLWLSRCEVIKEIAGIILLRGRANLFWGRLHFLVILIFVVVFKPS